MVWEKYNFVFVDGFIKIYRGSIFNWDRLSLKNLKKNVSTNFEKKRTVLDLYREKISIYKIKELSFGCVPFTWDCFCLLSQVTNFFFRTKKKQQFQLGIFLELLRDGFHFWLYFFLFFERWRYRFLFYFFYIW